MKELGIFNDNAPAAATSRFILEAFFVPGAEPTRRQRTQYSAMTKSHGAEGLGHFSKDEWDVRETWRKPLVTLRTFTLEAA